MQRSSQNHSMARSPYRGLFRDAMAETARTQRHIYVGSSLDDLRDQPGFDRAGFHPDSKAVREGSAFGKPSGAESYFIVVTNREHHLTLDGRVFPGSTDLPLVHERRERRAITTPANRSERRQTQCLIRRDPPSCPGRRNSLRRSKDGRHSFAPRSCLGPIGQDEASPDASG